MIYEIKKGYKMLEKKTEMKPLREFVIIVEINGGVETVQLGLGASEQ